MDNNTSSRAVTGPEAPFCPAIDAEHPDSAPLAPPSGAFLPFTSPLGRRAARKRARAARLLTRHALSTGDKDLALAVLELRDISPQDEPSSVVAVLADAGRVLARSVADDISRLMTHAMACDISRLVDREGPSPAKGCALAENAARGARLVSLVADALAASVHGTGGAL